MSTTSRIKQAAKSLFAAKGFKSVTVKEIGRKSRTNPALINYHFGSKEALYYAIIEDFTSMSRETARTVLRTPKSPEAFIENLDLYIRLILERYLKDPDLHIILHRESEKALALSKLNSFADQMLEIFYVLEKYYAAAKVHHILNPNIDERITTLLLFCNLGAICHHNALHEKFLKISLNQSRDFEAIAQLLLKLYGSSLLK